MSEDYSCIWTSKT